ncbi:MAG: hypothetical protein HY216_02970 [Candidatus Rokubacteria bacterium]|nr:hypothetical protein [Candidatus Rokubacteria bacterium]
MLRVVDERAAIDEKDTRLGDTRDIRRPQLARLLPAISADRNWRAFDLHDRCTLTIG